MSNFSGNNNFIGFDKYSKSGAYHWDAININDEYKNQSSIIIKYATENNFNYILDIGCGDGAIAGKLGLLCPSSKIYGFDAEQSAIDCAVQKLNEFSINNVFLTKCNIEEAISIYDISFNLIFSLDVIEHLPNPQELLDFVSKYTCDIIIGTPIFVGEEFMSPYHVKEYTQEELLKMFGDSLQQEWILSGKRKSKYSGKKTFFEKNYYMCRLRYA